MRERVSQPRMCGTISNMLPAPTSIIHRGVNRAINLIQSDPRAVMDLDEIADAAYLSKFHFSRLFRSCMGETPVSFLWRTRLEHSALDFDYGASKSITDTALEYGFSSPEAFSRAFSRVIGHSPRSFLSEADPFTPKVAPEILDYAQIQGGLRVAKITPPDASSVRIKNLPAYRVAFLRRKGPYEYYGGLMSGIADDFKAVINHALVQGVLSPDSIAIGASYNSPRLTRPEQCLFDVCVSIDAGVINVPSLDTQTLEGGRFAVLRVKCSTSQIAEYWNWLTFEWLPKSSERLGIGSSIERFEIGEVLSNSTCTQHTVDLCLRLRS